MLAATILNAPLAATILNAAQEYQPSSTWAISPIAKFHHVLGRGFMIQREILIFIKCLSANQNQLFYMKV